jgi:hypothetical protein
VPLARTRLFCPVRSSALSQRHSRACCRTPVLAALLHSRAFSTHKVFLPCTLFCALTAALTCLLHEQGSLALYVLRPQLHSRARCTHKAFLPCTLFCALTAALTCLLHAQGSLALYALRPQLHSRARCTHKALLPCTLPCALSCTHVPLARTRLFCPVRSSALSQRHSRACCRTPVLAALLHSRAFSTHKAVLPCTLSCAFTAALTCLLHAQSSLALYAPLRPQLHSRARCTHRLSCLVRSFALAC